MSNTDDSLVREVNEELRREQIAKLWDRYGLIALAGVGLFIAALLGYQYWRKVQLETAQEFGAQYQQALQLAQEGKSEESAKILMQMAKEAPKGYAVLARLKLAAAKAKAGKKDEAVRTYEAVVNDGGADPLLAGYAKLRAAALRVGEADWTEMQNRLNDLTGDDSAWRYSARELLGLAALKAGQLDEARKLFLQVLGDRQTPRSIRTRVTIMMGMIAQRELANAKSDASSGDKTEPAANKPAGGQSKTDGAKADAVKSN